MPGTVLLLAASPVGKGCLVDAASVLPVLAAVPPAVLSGTDTANVVELADPLEPQAVLTRLRAAAAAPGPLTVFVTGQLQLDRRQRLPHLALARTTPASVRYTALPWHWIREELRLRAPGTTTLFVDLRADPETWEWLRANPLDSGRNNAVYGRIGPPPARRTVAVPSYMKAVATILRSGHRPPPEQLHQHASARLGAEGYADLVLTAPDAAGRTAAPPPYRPGTTRPPTQDGPAHADPYGVVSAGVGDLPAVVSTGVGDPHRVVTAGVGDPYAVVSAGVGDLPAVVSTGVGDPHRVVTAGVGDPYAVVSAGVGDPSAVVPAGVGDPHAAISAAVAADRHADADALAAYHEQAAAHAHGPASEEALHWTEVRADLAMFAGDSVRSCRTWLAVATARLSAGQPADAAGVETSVDRAHHQWGQIGDPVRARELGPALAELRSRVPGRRQGALDHVRRQLRQLQTQG